MRGYWQSIVFVILCLLAVGVAWGASGSWVATAPGVRVAIPEREVHSQSLSTPSSLPSQMLISKLRWRFDSPLGQSIQAWLCHPRRCIPLSSPSGQSRMLAGLSASAPLYFQFRLPRGGQAVEVTGLQVIVDYQ
ncbi:flagellar protein FlhE [Litchfieldella anticariensis]|uniref:flagellar protein FlhE n=1 Tax=Litchfieldella anticariensis TaxID=258591 RepID=UPI000416B111